MATSKAAKPAKTTKKAAPKTAKTVSINIHLPGETAGKQSFPTDTTVAQLVSKMNLTGYTVSLNGSTVSSTSSTSLKKDDTIRVSVPTKNGWVINMGVV